MKVVRENVTEMVAKGVERFSEMVARGAVGKSIMPLGYEVEEPKELLAKKLSK